MQHMPQKLASFSGFGFETNQAEEAKNKKELANGREYLQYFQNKHSEKHLDQWIKNFLPSIKSGEHVFRKNSKLQNEIMRGNVPMCYRGEIWANMIGNDLRINSQVFNAFNNDVLMQRTSDLLDKNREGEDGCVKLPGPLERTSAGRALSPYKQSSLILKDIPRTFPHLNSLFEEVHSLSTSLKDILGAFNSFRPDIGYV